MARISSASASGASSPSVTMELDGKPWVVRNTFIDVDDAVDQPSSFRTISAPPVCLSQSPVHAELLSQLRLRLPAACTEERSDASDVEVAGVVSSQVLSTGFPNSESVSSSGASSPRQLPCKPFGAASAASTHGTFHDFAFMLASASVSTGCPSPKSVKSSRASSWAVCSEEVGQVVADDAVCSEEVGQVVADDRTTLMFRHLPEGFTRARLEDLLDTEGFADCYDFLYLPADMASGACFGYAIVNMVTPKDARDFVGHFEGFEQWSVPSEKRAEAHPNEKLQGLEELIGHWRNSSIMHPSVRDALRPAMYRNGRWSPFPQPTKRLKPPQTKNAARRNANARRA